MNLTQANAKDTQTDTRPADAVIATLTQAFAIALEGECDPRREPERGTRMHALLDGLPEEQLEAIRVACQRLEEAAVCAQIRKYGLKPMPAASKAMAS